MTYGFEALTIITDAAGSREQRLVALRDFAHELGLTPSYGFQNSFGIDGVSEHLVVEHGLDNTAVFSFLESPFRPTDLSRQQISTLLTLSYNNLVDWQILVSDSEALICNNLKPRNTDLFRPISRDNIVSVLKEDLELLFQTRRPATALPCDDVFIRAISNWKKLLKAEYRDKINNHNLASLFNSIILVRFYEDYVQLKSARHNNYLRSSLFSEENVIDYVSCLSKTLKKIDERRDLADFVDIEAINAFTCMDLSTAVDLTRDFYRPVAAEYPFNFALMSKHALSKIYERYVAILDFDEEKSRQTSLFPELPEESIDRKIGAVYTPQYIATFFSKYIQENVPPRLFRKLKSIDPACGSGIFIRTLLEFQCNPFVAEIHRETISRTFSLATAIDRDQNACDATRLSLSLLHLSITGLPPETLNIRAENSISLAMLKKLKANHYDAVISNPPYIPLERIPKEEKQLYEDYLDGHCVGRIDSYLAFVKLSLTIVKPGGFVCLVIPHNFLLAKNATILRGLMRENFWIKVIADLSEIDVFEGIGVYVILLILQKKSSDLYNDGRTQVIKAKGFVGRALQICLERKRIEAPFYAVYDIDQDTLGDERWVLLPPSEINLQRKLRRFTTLTSYFDVKQGFISGNDSVFVRRKSEITKEERKVYLAYLPDKQMERYRIRKKLNQVVFYPYEDGKALKEADLKTNYPRTWKYLTENKNLLTQRLAVTSGDTRWWRPVRPRSPKNMLRAKIVCPHLVLTPRFAIDLEGNVAVSHSPFLFTRSNFEALEVPMLKLYCAILNSSVVAWYLSRHGYKYSRGYIRLEVHTLETVPVPNLDGMEYELKTKILKMVDWSLVHGTDPDVESEIDRAVAQLYGLTDSEYNIVAGLTKER